MILYLTIDNVRIFNVGNVIGVCLHSHIDAVFRGVITITFNLYHMLSTYVLHIFRKKIWLCINIKE